MQFVSLNAAKTKSAKRPHVLNRHVARIGKEPGNRFDTDALASNDGPLSLAHELAGTSDVAWFLIRGDGGELMLVSDLAQLIHDRQFISGFFIDLDIAAEQLVERAGRPLFSINVSSGTFGRRIRRVTNGRVLSLVS